MKTVYSSYKPKIVLERYENSKLLELLTTDIADNKKKKFSVNKRRKKTKLVGVDSDIEIPTSKRSVIGTGKRSAKQERSNIKRHLLSKATQSSTTKYTNPCRSIS